MGKTRKQICPSCGNRMRGENIPGSIQKKWICDGDSHYGVKIAGCGKICIICPRCKVLTLESEIYIERTLCTSCANRCGACSKVCYSEDIKLAHDTGQEICEECSTDCYRCDRRYGDASQMIEGYTCSDCFYANHRWIMKYFTVALGCNHQIPKAIIMCSYWDLI